MHGQTSQAIHSRFEAGLNGSKIGHSGSSEVTESYGSNCWDLVSADTFKLCVLKRLVDSCMQASTMARC